MVYCTTKKQANKQTKQRFSLPFFSLPHSCSKKTQLAFLHSSAKDFKNKKTRKTNKKTFFFFFASALLLKASKLFAFLYPTLEKKGSFSLSLLIRKMTSFISPSGLLSQSFYMASHFSVNSSWISC